MATNRNDPSVQVRPGRAEDVPFVFDCIRALAEFEGLSHEFRGTRERLRDDLFGVPPRAELLIGEASGRTAGYALFFATYSTFETRPGIFLEDLYVVPDARRRGVAGALLGELARLAVERGCARLEWSVLDWNERAIAFYDSLGAGPVRGWTTYRLTGPALAAVGMRGGTTA